MPIGPATVLFLCTGNSARSILAEAILNDPAIGQGRFRGVSAGSHPRGSVNPLALEILREAGLPTTGLRSKSWEEFGRPDSPPLDFVFTMCDDAAGETCPIWPGHPATAHWGLPDPAAVDGDDEARRACVPRRLRGDPAAHRAFHRITVRYPRRRRPGRTSRRDRPLMNATTRPDPVPLLADGDTLGVVGMGVMGCTILKGLLAAGALAPERVWGTSRSADTCREVSADLGVPVEPDVQHRLASAGVVVLCVKPAQAPVALAALAAAGLRPDALVVSIAAGVDSTQISTHARHRQPDRPGHAQHAVRRRRGHDGDLPRPARHADAPGAGPRIFECVGRAVETEEKHFNAITALSGSGPAYHYLIMEAMADAGVRVGLPRDLALALVSQTTLGAARMVQTSGRHPAALRDDVTTPAGCTIGGLLMLEDGKIRSVLARAIEEATRIASKLGPAGPSKPAGDPH